MAGRLFARVADTVLSLIGTLSQSATNGGSYWGTSSAPTLGAQLGDGCAWGNRTVAGSHPQRDMPDTGVTRYYDFTVARQTLAPDGVTQSLITVNGQFPGPLIEANWGDWIEVSVVNQITGPEEGTIIHWHGLDQRGTPWMDGVASVSTCPIAPGANLTYKFRADHYGTSWYHAHYSAQYSAGALGPMVIHGPIQDGAAYDIDLGPVMVMDWYHDSYEHIVTEVETGGVTSPANVFRPHADSNLVQGKGYFPCANVTNGAACGNAGFATFDFTPGKTHRLRFINTGSIAFETISIDNHTMTVIANDFVPVQPYQTNFITLGVGQRTDVIVEATGEPGQSYWLRSWNDPFCGDNNNPDGRAIIFYPDADTSVVPDSIGLPTPIDSQCHNDPLSETVPVYVIPVADPDTTITITMAIDINGTGTPLFAMNGVAYQGDFNDPILQDALNGVTSFNPVRNVYPQGDNSTVRIVFINTIPSGHGMHLHGHNFQVLAEGLGTWDGTITNPQNPQRRDVQQSWGGPTNEEGNTTYLVLQYEQNNPGLWPFHCHIAWHVSAGMAVMLEELPDQIPGLKSQQPSNILATCDAWDAYTAANIVTDNDSGLKVRGLTKDLTKKKLESKITMAMSDDDFIRGLKMEKKLVV